MESPHTCAALEPRTSCINENKTAKLSGTSHSILTDNNTADGGVRITGDGPLTPGGLNSGQPAMSTPNIIINNTLKDNTQAAK